MATVDDLPAAARAIIANLMLDRLLEKHEQLRWKWMLPQAILLDLGRLRVLLPVNDGHRSHLALLRRFDDPHGAAVVLLLRDLTFWRRLHSTAPPPDLDGDVPMQFLAVCVWLPEGIAG